MSVSFHNHNHENNNHINPPPPCSAGTPTRRYISCVYQEELDYFPKESTAIVPFKWEAVPGTPLHHLTHHQQNKPTSCKCNSTSDHVAAPSSSMSSWDDDDDDDDDEEEEDHQFSDSDEDSEINSNSEEGLIDSSNINYNDEDDIGDGADADSDQFEHKMPGRSTRKYTKPPNDNSCSPSIYPLRPPPKLIVPQHNNNLRVKDIINNSSSTSSSGDMNYNMSGGRLGGWQYRRHHDADYILLQERSRSFSLRASAAHINNMNSIVKRGIGAACRSFRFIHNNNYAAAPAPKYDKSDVSSLNEAKTRLRDLMEHSANFSTAATAAASFNNYMHHHHHHHHQILHEHEHEEAEETHNINQYIIAAAAAAADEADDEGAESLHTNYAKEQEQHQLNIHSNSFNSHAAISEIQETTAAHLDDLQYNYISSPKKVRSLSCCCWRP